MTRRDQPFVENVVPMQARTSSGDTGVLGGYGAPTALRLGLNVTAVSGTNPKLAVFVEDSLDGGQTWNEITKFLARSTVGTDATGVTSMFGPDLRVRWEITGTSPAFTFAVDLAGQ